MYGWTDEGYRKHHLPEIMVPATTAKLIAWMDELSVAWSTHQKQHHAECLAKNMRYIVSCRLISLTDVSLMSITFEWAEQLTLYLLFKLCKKEPNDYPADLSVDAIYPMIAGILLLFCRRGRFCVINSHAYSPLHWMKIFTLCWWHYIQVLSPSLNRSIPGAADSSANSTGQPSYSWCSWSKKLCLGGKYTSARYYRFLFERVPKNEIMISIWSSKTLPKIKVFLWLRMLDRLNTRDIMSRKNWTVDSGTDCS
jgi:hypothetical protein